MATSAENPAALHEHAGEFSNYDVLLAKTYTGEFILDPNKSHVGNNRFQILLDMHREEFDVRLVGGQNTDVVVKKIIDIVCRQCVPQGRFLLTKGNSSWMVLNEEEAEEFVLDILLTPMPGPSDETSPTALTKSMPMNKAPDLAPPSLHQSETAADLDSEKKRRRRSSLLRRSVSEGNFEDRKKLGRSTADTGKLPDILSKPEVLDIVFNHHMTKLTVGHTGNNRLAVVIKMQENTYRAAQEAEKMRMEKDVYTAVTESWKGRFLTQNPDESGYTVMDEDVTLLAIRYLFDPSSSSPLATTPTIAEDDAEDARSPSIVKKKSIQALHASESGSGMHSAALAALQKRKQKQTVHSRIRNLAARVRPLRPIVGLPLKPTNASLSRSTTAPASQSEKAAALPLATGVTSRHQSFGDVPSPSDYSVDFPLSFTPVPDCMDPSSSSDALVDLSKCVRNDGEMDSAEMMLSPSQDSRESMHLPRDMIEAMDSGFIEDLLSGLDVSGELETIPGT